MEKPNDKYLEITTARKTLLEYFKLIRKAIEKAGPDVAYGDALAKQKKHYKLLRNVFAASAPTFLVAATLLAGYRRPWPEVVVAGALYVGSSMTFTYCFDKKIKYENLIKSHNEAMRRPMSPPNTFYVS
jgi:hypothetical protein